MSEMTRLEASYRIAEYAEEQARHRQVDLAKRMDELALTRRPSYPTTSHVIGIKEAVRRIKEGVSSEENSCGPASDPYCVTAAPTLNWINLKNGSPWRKRGNGYLWSFEEAEVQKVIAEVEKHGVSVVKSWRGGDWLSLTIEVDSHSEPDTP